MQHDLFRFFDRCVVINLVRRADRLRNFQEQLDNCNWPFRPVEVLRAIDGSRVPIVPPWETGGGSWGCRQSHLRALEDALNDGIDNLLVLEDDAYVHRPRSFCTEIGEFLAAVPADWDALWIGGQIHNQHVRPSPEIKPGILKVGDCQRTHCYAVRGKAMKDLYLYYHNEKRWHIDWNLHKFQADHNVYAPSPFLFGQEQGQSDISGANNPRKLFATPPTNAPVYWFKNTSREVIEALREQYHFGRQRDGEGRDVGLVEIVGIQPKRNDRDKRHKVSRLKDWIKMIAEESYSMNAVTAIWHNDLDEETIRSAAGDVLVVLESPTVDQARMALPVGSAAA